jgi:beta-galactosidase
MIKPLEDRSLLAFVPPANPRIVANLDADWKFLRADGTNAQTPAFNDSIWSNVNVPHTWNNLDGQGGGKNYYRGIGWYRKHITPTASLAGKSMYLKFDGVNLTTDLYVNGALVGEHKGGFSAFGWDISSYLTVGADHVIAVKVNNAADNNDRMDLRRTIREPNVDETL